ncbi:hypothetical protein ACIQ4Z_23375 [Peribacillus asahii]|uniref:hypothetical protein n=1 Tax=Peribacillus asahii TaxID=228899 RepID=UPI0037F8F2A5
MNDKLMEFLLRDEVSKLTDEKRKVYQFIGVPVIHFNRFIGSIYEDRLDELSDSYINYYSWHINRIVGEIILADFNNYLHAAIDFIEKGIQLNYKTLSVYKFMPQIIFKEFKKEDREYFIYKKSNHNINYEMIENCNCPGIRTC